MVKCGQLDIYTYFVCTFVLNFATSLVTEQKHFNFSSILFKKAYIYNIRDNFPLKF